VPEGPTVVATDTSVCINLIHAGRLDILGRLARWSFAITEHVEHEISHPEQAQALVEAIADGVLHREAITDPRELEHYAELIRARIGRGEASCVVIASERGWIVASDERGRFLRVARERLGPGRLVNTAGLLSGPSGPE
jgi:predicted nucleic acid-binding protein